MTQIAHLRDAIAASQLLQDVQGDGVETIEFKSLDDLLDNLSSDHDK